MAHLIDVAPGGGCNGVWQFEQDTRFIIVEELEGFYNENWGKLQGFNDENCGGFEGFIREREIDERGEAESRR